METGIELWLQDQSKKNWRNSGYSFDAITFSFDEVVDLIQRYVESIPSNENYPKCSIEKKLNSEPSVQVSNTTGDDSSTKDGK
jgi:hypothetical protein